MTKKKGHHIKGSRDTGSQDPCYSQREKDLLEDFIKRVGKKGSTAWDYARFHCPGKEKDGPRENVTAGSPGDIGVGAGEAPASLPGVGTGTVDIPAASPGVGAGTRGIPQAGPGEPKKDQAGGLEKADDFYRHLAQQALDLWKKNQDLEQQLKIKERELERLYLDHRKLSQEKRSLEGKVRGGPRGTGS